MASAPAAAAASADWRSSVTQSQRNAEIRGIAKVLSSLEPGSTPNQKLSLALRFEDQFWKSCKSHEEYRAKMLKRLNKLRKNYVPPTPPAAPESDAEERALLREMREEHGGRVRFVLEHGHAAVERLRRIDARQAETLRNHVRDMWHCAAYIGLTVDGADAESANDARTERVRRSVNRRTIRRLLSQRVESIRQLVLQHSDPHGYLEEELVKADRAVTENRHGVNAVLSEAAASSANNATNDPDEATLMTWVERASRPVPTSLPRKEAVAEHLRRLRFVANVLPAFLTVAPKTTTATSRRRNSLKRTHRAAVESGTFLEEHSLYGKHHLRKRARTTTTATGTAAADDEGNGVSSGCDVDRHSVSSRTDNASSSVPPPRRPRRSSLRTRVLFRPGQRTPSYIRQALREKRVELSASGTSIEIALSGGDAADEEESSSTPPAVRKATVYFSPLLVSFEPSSSDDHDDASTAARATRVLRECFGDVDYSRKDGTDAEISETSALMKFIGLARERFGK